MSCDTYLDAFVELDPTAWEVVLHLHHGPWVEEGPVGRMVLQVPVSLLVHQSAVQLAYSGSSARNYQISIVRPPDCRPSRLQHKLMPSKGTIMELKSN